MDNFLNLFEYEELKNVHDKIAKVISFERIQLTETFVIEMHKKGVTTELISFESRSIDGCIFSSAHIEIDIPRTIGIWVYCWQNKMIWKTI